jgi:flavodoxin
VTKKFEQRLFYVSDTGITAMVAQFIQLEIEDSLLHKIKNRRQKLMKPMMYCDMQIISNRAFINFPLC